MFPFLDKKFQYIDIYLFFYAEWSLQLQLI